MGCDTLVALAPATRDGVTLFAKNSDRPPRECQRIVTLPAGRHAAGTMLRCQYLEVPQVAETHAVIGSQPHWLWGLEHGVNAHRVAIGNETVFARESLPAIGLTGMDLVRLGLERGRTASEALEVMTSLIEAHGQGGSGHLHLDWPYHNAFLIADPGAAWVLETSGRHWAARPVDVVANISNGLDIRADWTRGSADLTAFAVEQGWWPVERGRVDVATAYADESGVPPNQCVERRRRAAAFLAEHSGQLAPAALRTVLRDHYDAGTVHRPRRLRRSLLLLHLHARRSAGQHDRVHGGVRCRRIPAPSPRSASASAVRASARSFPCGSMRRFRRDSGSVAAIPIPPARGGACATLLDLVERDVARHGPPVRARWDAFEAATWQDAAQVERGRPREGPARASLLRRIQRARRSRRAFERRGGRARRWGTLDARAGGGLADRSGGFMRGFCSVPRLRRRRFGRTIRASERVYIALSVHRRAALRQRPGHRLHVVLGHPDRVRPSVRRTACATPRAATVSPSIRRAAWCSSSMPGSSSSRASPCAGTSTSRSVTWRSSSSQRPSPGYARRRSRRTRPRSARWGPSSASDAAAAETRTTASSASPRSRPRDARSSISDTTSVCWTFTGAGGNTCNADSGGPLFVGSGSAPSIAGVTSGGSSNSCLPTDDSFDANIAHYASYIASRAVPI